MNMERMRSFLRKWFSLTRSERRGFIIVSLFLVFAIVLNVLSVRMDSDDSFDYAEISQKLDILQQLASDQVHESPRSLFQFDPNALSESDFESLDIPDRVKRNIISYRQKGGKFKKPDDLRKIYGMNDSLYELVFPFLTFQVREPKLIFRKENESSGKELFVFDPNTASMDTLRELGFSDFAADNLCRYISKGGVIRKKEDLLKIYGVDNDFFGKIAPYIALDSTKGFMKGKVEPSVIELNSADSTILVSIPGIGPTYASRIIRYRKLLGGYYNSEQLLEVYGVTEALFHRICPYLEIDTVRIEKKKINLAEYSDLRTHPYISNRQARLIVDSRSDRGPWGNINELKLDTIFSRPEFERVSHYLTLW